jgi:hypothetical protein
MLAIVIVTLVPLFAAPTLAQQSQPPAATTIQPAAASPSSTTKLQIAKLPANFEGRWERTFPNLQIISNMTKFTITSQDETGKILGTFTSWSYGSFRCSTVINVPMEGEYDGETLIVRAKPNEPGCDVWRLTLKPGVSHMFEWKSSEKGDTLGRPDVAGVGTAYYDAVK